MTEEEAKSWNYTDALHSAATAEYYAMQNDTAIQQTGRTTYIFKLDKKVTDTSNVYGDATHGRIYLPHFEQRALYKSVQWAGELGLNIYEEKEENTELTFNFDRMVNNIRALKNKVSGKMTIGNSNEYPIRFVVEDGYLTIDGMSTTIIKEDLSKFGSIKALISAVNSNTTSNITMTYEGDGERASLMQSMDMAILPGHTKYVDIKNGLYENCTDVIELGDLIMTDKYKLFTVVSAYPSDDSINDYVSWTVKGSIIDMSKVDGLPEDYRAIINRSRYGLPKVNME